jgi:hypothetical protein
LQLALHEVDGRLPAVARGASAAGRARTWRRRTRLRHVVAHKVAGWPRDGLLVAWKRTRVASAPRCRPRRLALARAPGSSLIRLLSGRCVSAS